MSVLQAAILTFKTTSRIQSVFKEGMCYATPMFVVLVEATDLIFAVDSIPAIFAILGLRAMYFLLADMAERFHLLKYGLAIILMFIGAKMLLLDVYKIPTGIALGIVGLILLLSVAASLVTSRRSVQKAKDSVDQTSRHRL